MTPSDDRLLLERESLASLATSISHILTVQEPLHRMLQHCTESLVRHLDVALAKIWLLDPMGQTLTLAASAGLSPTLQGELRSVSVAGSLNICSIVQDGRPRLTNRLQEESWLRDPEWAKREGLCAYAGYPLIVQDRVIGVMAMFSRHEIGTRTLEELGGIAGGIAQCIRRSQTEEALRRSEERLALAIDGAGMAFWDWDLRSSAMVWSKQFFSLMGYDPVRTIPSRDAWLERVHPDDRERVIEEMARSGRNRSTVSHDYRIVTADTGQLMWVAGRGKFIYDEAGEAVRLIAALFNINHRKHAEAEIRRLLDEAQLRQQELREKQAQLVQRAKLASIGELTTGLAHELNNPLNNIALFVGNALDVVLEEVTPPVQERLASALHAANEQVSRAATIINHLRMFARSGKQHFVTLDINTVVKAAMDLLGERMRRAGIDTKVILDATPPLVDGCQVQLEQVFVNLLTNAIEAVKASPRKVVTISSTVTANGVVISINDTGVGIPAEHLPRIFDPFFTTKEVGEGTGLGLSIAFGIVKEHHGDITVDSRIGHGTTVTILIPISPSLRP